MVLDVVHGLRQIDEQLSFSATYTEFVILFQGKEIFLQKLSAILSLIQKNLAILIRCLDFGMLQVSRSDHRKVIAQDLALVFLIVLRQRFILLRYLPGLLLLTL